MTKVKVGIAGLGRIGILHARHLATGIQGCEVTAACSINDAELESAKREFGITHVYKDYSEMIEKAPIDAVVIATSTPLHGSQIEIALNAGKHVFTEKPMSVDIEECKRIEKCVEEHPDRVFMIGFMRRYDESYAYAKKKIKEGAIGKPYLVKATGLDPRSTIQTVLKYAKTSAGLFVSMGVHDIDLIHWFLESRASKVYAVGGNYAYPQFGEFGDIEVGCALYEMENGTMGILHTGRTAVHGYHIETEIIGTEGSIRISPVPQKNLAMLYKNDGVTIECVEEFRERFKKAYYIELREFINCILENRKPDVTVYEGTACTTAVLATAKAFKEKSMVEIRYR